MISNEILSNSPFKEDCLPKSVNDHSHGIIPDKLSQKVIEYHQRKGHKELFNQCTDNLENMRNLRSNRKITEVSVSELKADLATKKKTILADGQAVRVFDCKNTTSLSYTNLVRDGDFQVSDVAVNEAYDGSVATYNFYKKIFNINSIDDKHFPLNSFVHYSRNYNNAFWDGQRMVYGDGDGYIFNRFTIAMDIAAHEQSHGLTQERAGTAYGSAQGIAYENEAGGVNESYSDIIGIMVKQRALKQIAADSNWLIGEGLIKGARGLRDMKNPGTAFINHKALGSDTQVASYPEYLQRLNEDGIVGPHDSSGVVNKAFTTMALEFATLSPQSGKNSYDMSGPLFFKVLPKVKYNVTFKELAQLTIDFAKLRGEGSAQYTSVMKGWRAVQVIL